MIGSENARHRERLYTQGKRSFLPSKTTVRLSDTFNRRLTMYKNTKQKDTFWEKYDEWIESIDSKRLAEKDSENANE